MLNVAREVIKEPAVMLEACGFTLYRIDHWAGA